MNLKHHSGASTGDAGSRISAYCDLDRRHRAATEDIDILAPLDAPEWIPTSRIVCLPADRDRLEAVQFQQQTLRAHFG